MESHVPEIGAAPQRVMPQRRPRLRVSRGISAEALVPRIRPRAQRGFTLVELLVVITIIALIMGIVGPRVLNYLTESKAKAAKIQIESFASALDLFFLDTGRYPAGSEGLQALVRRPGNIASWNGPYLKGGVVPPDPWGNPYIYRAPGQNGAYDLLSYGSDGTEGGTGAAQDITSWQR